MGAGRQKNPEIEALRGIAILFVMFAHLGALLFKPIGLTSDDYFAVRNWVQPGTGVDLFFCISGFVITQSIFRHGRAPSFLAFALPFWVRRFWRLAPTVWLWAAIGLATVAWRVPEYLMSSSIDVLATIAQVQNFRVFDCMNHSVPPSCGAFVLYWSLSLEEQFYLLLPFVLWFLPRRVVPMLLIAVVLSQIFIERAFAGMLWLIRTDAICIGVLIALFSATKVYAALTPALLRHRPLAWGLLAVCCGIIASVDAPNAHFVRASVGMVAALSGILVWSASYDSGFAIPDGLLRRFLIYFGGRSYGLYVVHYSANWLISKLAEVTGLDDPTGYFRLLAIPTAILFAELNYRFVETPLRKYGAGVATRLAYRLSFPKIGAVQSIDMASGDDMGRADRFDRKYAGG